MTTVRFNNYVRIVGERIQKEEIRHGRPYCLQHQPTIYNVYNWKITLDFAKRVKERNPDAMSEFFKDYIHDYNQYLKETSAIPEKLTFYDSTWHMAVGLEHVRHSASADIVTEALRMSVPSSSSDMSLLPVYSWFGHYQEYLNPDGKHYIQNIYWHHKRQGLQGLPTASYLQSEFRWLK